MRLHCYATLLAALVSATVLTAPAWAMDVRDPAAVPPKAKSAPPAEAKPGFFQRLKKSLTRKPAKTSELFIDGYHHAHDLIYKQQDYAGAIVALRALDHDDHPDVANLIGFSSRKLGRIDDARVWYEKALAADPKHTRTWQYYGMWHLEQGNRLKAEEHLRAIEAICGSECEDFRSLKLALSGENSNTY